MSWFDNEFLSIRYYSENAGLYRETGEWGGASGNGIGR